MTYTIFLDSSFSGYSVDLDYIIPLIQTIDDGRQRGFTTISNQDPAAARHFGFQPGQSNPTIEFVMYDDGTDRSDGSLSNSNISDARFSNNTIKTVEEQKIWLTEYIHDNTSDARWRLFGGRFSDRNGDGTDEGTNVTIERTSITENADRQAALQVKMDLKLGVTI